MADNTVTDPEPKRSRRKPATTPEGRENQLVSKAVNLAELQLDEGTASAQVITHYLKLGSSRERLEQERLSGEVALLKAKIDSLESQKDMIELYTEAMKSMTMYQGGTVSTSEDDDA